jgi:hypothetical protein
VTKYLRTRDGYELKLSPTITITSDVDTVVTDGDATTIAAQAAAAGIDLFVYSTPYDDLPDDTPDPELLGATRGELNALKPLKVTKPSDTSRDSTTAGTLADDPHLVLALKANTLYRVEGFLVYDSTTTGDLILGVSAPAASTVDWTPRGLAQAATTTTGNLAMHHRGVAQSVNLGGAGAGLPVVATLIGYAQTGANAGDFRVRWAQAVADVAAPAIVKAGSRLFAYPLA